MAAENKTNSELIEENEQLRKRLNELEAFHNQLLRPGTGIPEEERESVSENNEQALPDQNKFTLLKRKVDQHLRTFALSAKTKAWEDSAESIYRVIHELEILQIESELEGRETKEKYELLEEVVQRLQKKDKKKSELLFTAGAELNRLESFLKIIFDSVPVSVFIVSENFKVIDHNFHSSGFFGIEESSLIDSSFTQFLSGISKNDANKIEDLLNGLIKKTKFSSIYLISQEDKNAAETLEIQFLNSAEIAGQQYHFLSVFKKSGLPETKEMNRPWKTLTSNLPSISLIVFDTAVKVLEADGEIFFQQNRKPDQLIGKHLDSILDREIVKLIEPVCNNALKGIFTAKEIFLSKEWYYIQSIPLKGKDKNIYGGLAVFQNITRIKEYGDMLAKKQAQQLIYNKVIEKMNQSINRITENAAQNYMLSLSDLLTAGKSNDERREELFGNTFLLLPVYMKYMLQTLALWSKTELNDYTYTKQTVNSKEAFSDLFALLSHFFEAQKRTASFSFSDEIITITGKDCFLTVIPVLLLEMIIHNDACKNIKGEDYVEDSNYRILLNCTEEENGNNASGYGEAVPFSAIEVLCNDILGRIGGSMSKTEDSAGNPVLNILLPL